MKAFFKNLNLARAIMLFSLVGALALGLYGWQRHRRFADLRRNYEQDIANVVHQVMQLGRKHTQLTLAARKDSLTGQADLESYIRSIAAADRVDIGNVNISNSAPASALKGVVDKTYWIKHSDKDRSFSRSMIANFLYKLESDSRRVKVTEIKLEAAEKRLKPHEIPEDKWTFEAELTSRQRVDE